MNNDVRSVIVGALYVQGRGWMPTFNGEPVTKLHPPYDVEFYKWAYDALRMGATLAIGGGAIGPSESIEL